VTVVAALFFEPIARQLITVGILPSKYLLYFEMTEGSASPIMLFLAKLPFVLAVAIFGRKLIDHDSRNTAVISFVIIGCIVSMLSVQFGYASRIGLAFNVWEIVFIGELYEMIKAQIKDPKVSIILYSGIVIVLLLFWWYNFDYRNFGYTVPYFSDIANYLNV
jgi:hypothetical protein